MRCHTERLSDQRSPAEGQDASVAGCTDSYTL